MNRRISFSTHCSEYVSQQKHFSKHFTLRTNPHCPALIKRREITISTQSTGTVDGSGQNKYFHKLQLSEERVELPTQGQSAVAGVQLEEATSPAEKTQQHSEVDYLAELLAIQQNGAKDIGFFGTRNMGFTHQKLVEILSYALVLTGNHIYTSGATGTNAAVIRGALRAENPDKLTVVLPQSLSKQPQESQELVKQVSKLIEMPHNDQLSLFDASKLCNQHILTKIQQVICFAFHDSRLMLDTCEEARQLSKIVTLFYLD
eukprot:g3045.t1